MNIIGYKGQNYENSYYSIVIDASPYYIFSK